MVSGYLALLVIFAYLLIQATDHLVDELRDIARITKIGKFGLTAFLLAFATSLPELVVGIASAIEKRPILSLGNVLGSNIADVSLVMGGVAVVGGSFKVLGEFLKRDLFSTFLAGSLPLLLLVDGGLSHYAWLIFWVVLLVFSADMLVRISSLFAGALGIPVILIGIFFVAVGTSLPEFAFELKAMRSEETAMVFGDLLGSVVANSTLVLGVTALIHPIFLDGGFQPYLLATVAFVVIFGLFWFFVSTKRILERWEGVLLLLVYVLFAILEFSRVNGYELLDVIRGLTTPF
jgi:cation:H+ antiporter